ncbi:hypothetical protein CRUP_002441 [Coryphaenoides rupestris]|nr:hypothetical protein CRUP_002441 [Coryphaenoides rupestris]
METVLLLLLTSSTTSLLGGGNEKNITVQVHLQVSGDVRCLSTVEREQKKKTLFTPAMAYSSCVRMC